MRVIDQAYTLASRELLRHFIYDLDLKARLRSFRAVFFLQKSDWLLQFMLQASCQELEKQYLHVNIQRLESALDLAFKSSSLSSDPFASEFEISLHTFSIEEAVQKLIHQMDGGASNSAGGASAGGGSGAGGEGGRSSSSRNPYMKPLYLISSVFTLKTPKNTKTLILLLLS